MNIEDKELAEALLLFEETETLEEDVLAKEIKAFEALVAKIRPIMRHIDKPIVSSWFAVGDAPEKFQHLEDNGVKLRGVVIADNFHVEKTDGSSGSYLGSKLYLLRDGSLLRLERSGSYSNWRGEVCQWVAATSVVDSREAIAEYCLAEISQGISKALQASMMAAKTKQKTLQGRLNKVEQVNEILAD